MEKCRIDACLYNYIYDDDMLCTEDNYYKGFYTSNFYFAENFCDKFNIEYNDKVEAMQAICKIVKDSMNDGKYLFTYKIENDGYGIPQVAIVLSNNEGRVTYNLQRIPYIPTKYFVQTYCEYGIFGEGSDNIKDMEVLYKFYSNYCEDISIMELVYTPDGMKYKVIRSNSKAKEVDMHCDTISDISKSFMVYGDSKRRGTYAV